MVTIPDFQPYRWALFVWARPYVPGERLTNVKIGDADRRDEGSPKLGDYIARHPDNPSDMWLITAKRFARHYMSVPPEINPANLA